MQPQQRPAQREEATAAATSILSVTPASTMSPSANRTVPVRPVHPAPRRARRPYDSLTLPTHPLPLAASVMASTVRGSSNHGHTYTCGNTRVHDESLNKSDSTCPLSEPCSLTSLTSLRLSHTLHPLASPADAAAPPRRSRTHRPLCSRCSSPNEHTHTHPEPGLDKCNNKLD